MTVSSTSSSSDSDDSSDDGSITPPSYSDIELSPAEYDNFEFESLDDEQMGRFTSN